MLRKPHYIALGLVVVLVVILLHLPPQVSVRLKLAISGLFLPLFGLTSSLQSLAGKAGDSAIPRSDLLRELEQLRRENQQLRLQLQQADETRRENTRLHQLLAFPKPASWKLKAARVIGRDPANWWRTIFIDCGSRDGVQPDLPVFNADGLVGRVSAVGLARSQVVLLGDPNCRVAAMVKETGETGVIAPNSSNPLDSGLVNLTYLSRTGTPKPGQSVVSGGLELKPGNAVLSSGLGGIFPKGIPIGQVADTRTVAFGLYSEARVKLSANLNALEEVWVLVQ